MTLQGVFTKEIPIGPRNPNEMKRAFLHEWAATLPQRLTTMNHLDTLTNAKDSAMQTMRFFIALMALATCGSSVPSEACEPKEKSELGAEELCKPFCEKEQAELAEREAAFCKTLPSMSVAELLANINKFPEPKASQYTPAIHELVKRGNSVLPELVTHLNDDDECLRCGVQLAMQGITYGQCGYEVGDASDFREEEWKAYWKKLGDYQWNMPEEGRLKAKKLWEAELRKKSKQRQSKGE